MSVQAMSRVLEMELPSSEKFVLLSIANHADPYGRCSYPSVSTICRETSLAESTVRGLLGWLRTKGFLLVDKPSSQHRPTIYSLNIGLPAVPTPDTLTKEMREQVIFEFRHTCVYCSGEGDEKHGPDGKPWQVDRIIPAGKKGRYEASNVTLACAHCNLTKNNRPAPEGTPSLADMLKARPLETGPLNKTVDLLSEVQNTAQKRARPLETGPEPSKSEPSTTEPSKYKRRTAWPEVLFLSQEMMDYAVARGIENPETEFDAWHDDCLAHGRKYENWMAAWRMRVRNHKKFSWGEHGTRQPIATGRTESFDERRRRKSQEVLGEIGDRAHAVVSEVGRSLPKP